jgi:pimeloyl-ACP methyl ester carboxylesterase
VHEVQIAVLSRRHLRMESSPTVTTTPIPPPVLPPKDTAQFRPSRPGPPARRHIGRVVAGSLATGFVAAMLLVAAPFIPAEESELTGAVLCGFGVGWAMLAVCSVRFTDQPQRWAMAPAVFMGLGGLLLVVFGSSVREMLSWVWPPVLLGLVVWMVVQAHRHLRSRSRRWLLYPVFAVLAVASVGGGYETVSTATASALAMPGQLIDVGGHRLHLSCTGSGGPTVVLQPGAGEMAANMGWIAPAVARNTRVCVYDRAGRGWSDPGDTPQDATQIAIDLHTLLHRAHVPGPYVLAGHSFGGLYVLTFAATYPDEVAGMVVVDTTAPATKPGTPTRNDGDSYNPLDRASALLSMSARLGVTRLYSPFEGGSLPPTSQDQYRASIVTASNLRSTIDEYVQANTSMKEAASFTDFGAKPLVVLTAGVGSDAALVAAHDRVAALSTNSVHRVINGADHEALIADKHHSAATTQAILDVVSSVRSGKSMVR